MRNLYFYVKTYGTKSFQEFPFNEVDSLLLSQLSYLNLDLVIPKIQEEKPSVSLVSLLSSELIGKLSKETLDEKRNRKLLNLLMTAPRYEGLKMNYLMEQFHVEKVEQFSAVTFLFEEFSYIAYRGTDLTLIGWFEDFNMALLDVIPSQEDAATYLNKISLLLPEGNFYIGGHSKGGNLAVYASLSCSKEIKNRIISIFDHDGPGFNRDIFQSKEYLEIEAKIFKTTCKEARVGILLHHSERMSFVDSRSLGILQHDPYNWKITKQGRFKLVRNANLISRTFEKTVNNFIETTSLEDRRKFLDIMYQLSVAHPKATIFDFKRKPVTYSIGIRRRYKGLSLNQKIFLKKTLKRYRVIWRANFQMYLKRKIRFKDKT